MGVFYHPPGPFATMGLLFPKNKNQIKRLCDRGLEISFLFFYTGRPTLTQKKYITNPTHKNRPHTFLLGACLSSGKGGRRNSLNLFINIYVYNSTAD